MPAGTDFVCRWSMVRPGFKSLFNGDAERSGGVVVL